MTRRRLETRQAGTVHALEALKSLGSGERRGKHTRRGGLGAAIHLWPSNHTGAESGEAYNGGVAGWEQPWRCGLPKLVRLESGVAHTQTVAGWELPFTVRSQSCVVHGRLVAKGCMVGAAQLPVFLGLLCDCPVFERLCLAALFLGAAVQLPVFFWEPLCSCTCFFGGALISTPFLRPQPRTYRTATQPRTPPSPFFPFLGS